jgi:Mor family transcriptional regulator
MTDAAIVNLIGEGLPEPYAEILEAIGAESMIKLVRVYGGTALYIPTIKSLCKESIYRKIVKEYNGYNIKELAKKYDVSMSTVYNVLGASGRKTTRRADVRKKT